MADGGSSNWRGGRKGAPPAAPGAADWRGGGRTSRGASTPGQAKEWNPPTPAAPIVIPHLLKLAALALVLAALVAAYLVWLLYRPTRTPFLALAVADYPAPVPPNGWVEEDLRRFESLGVEDRDGGKGAGILTYHRCPYDSSQPYHRQTGNLKSFAALAQQIAETEKGGGRHHDVIVVYLSMHGVVNAQGEPCLLPPRAEDLLDCATWPPLEQVLEYLFPESLDHSIPKHRLVVLDCHRIDAHWPLGILYNGFSAGLDDVVRRTNVPGLILLNSTRCDWSGQTGWTSHEHLGGSVFGYFLSEALRGAAERDGDGQLALDELEAYLQDRVDQYVRERRADSQVPEIKAKTPMPSLSLVNVKQAAERRPDPIAWDGARHERRWRELDARWLEHASRRPAALRDRPLRWGWFEQELLRAEGLAVAASDATPRIPALESGPLLPRERIAAYNLPLARRWRAGPDDEGQRELLLASWADESKLDPQATWTYRAAVDAGQQMCADGGLPEDFRKAFDRVERSEPGTRPPADFIELHFLRMLDAHLDRQQWPESVARIRRAVETRRRAEQAAAPADERILHWLRPLVSEGDDQRRRAEDALFVGASDRPDGRQQYESAASRAGEIEAAYEARDRAWALLPHFAGWLLSRWREEVPPRTESELRELIAATSELATRLEDHSRAGEPQLPTELAAAARRVGELLDALEDAFGKERDKILADGTQDKADLPPARVLFATPLLTGKDRGELRGRYERVLHEGDRDAGRGGGSPERGHGSDPARGQLFLDRVTRWEIHPVLEILASGPACAKHLDASTRENLKLRPATGEPGPETDALRKPNFENLCKQGQVVRQILGSLRGDLRAELRESETQLHADRADDTFRRAREACCRAEQTARACAGLLPVDPARWDEEEDAIARLRKIDLFALLQWQARRALDDFWGPPPREDAQRGSSYFGVVARHYLDAAAGLFPDAPNTASLEPDDLETLLARRLEAAREGIDLEVGDVRVDGDAAAGAMPLRFTKARTAQAMPPGEAALSVENPSRKVVPVLSGAGGGEPRRRFGLPVPAAQLPSALIRNRDLLEGAGRGWRALALFRGHVYGDGRTFFVEPPQPGSRVVYEPPRKLTTTVRVTGDASETNTVVFVLDYSNSMDVPEDDVDEHGNRVRRQRYEIARAVLFEMLDALAEHEREFRVGLRLFGHRVRQNSRGELEVPNPEKPGTFMPRPAHLGITLQNDVEQILRPTPFGRAERNQVVARLLGDRQENRPELKPLGATPLYYAISLAVDDLREVRDSSGKHIIVITDGVDDRSLDPQDYIRDHRELQAKLQPDQRIQLDVVGFHSNREAFRKLLVDSNFPDVDAKLREYETKKGHVRELAERTGGEFREANDAARLLLALQESLQLRKFMIEDVRTGLPVTEDPRRLNSPPVTIDVRAEPVRLRYRVRIVGAQPAAETEIELRGGEAIELELSGDRRRLEHRRYARELIQAFENCPAPRGAPGPERYYVASHGYVEDRTTTPPVTEFRFSVQNQAAAEFSPRPEEAWIEILPVAGGEPMPGKAYHFYDLRFKEETPVPVLCCRAVDWPGEATEAWARVWFLPSAVRTPPAYEASVRELGDKGRFRVEAIANVEFEVKRVREENGTNPRVVVVEEHAPGSDLKAVKVEAASAPLRIEREFKPRDGRVEHTFFFDDLETRRVDGYPIVFTPAQPMFEASVTLPDAKAFRILVSRYR